ncbi:hypothetical protein [Streptomyces sp. ISL-86]|uniref:hypothetical protein n=1 Tax=Streptomyces sp. ISL-86 TaxID=2819187 RepID=UPI001BEB38C2|nr:hypothetical protein [Streptomyces sp. ISL-86]MBT2459763.1 hypothetical protein [Streptomyces sp. ISL-86]
MPETTTMPLAPMTPHAVMSAFNYLRAVEAGDTEAAAEFVAAEPRMPALLLEVAERIVIPVTNLPGQDQEEVPCDASFALFELGICFLGTLRSWHEQDGAEAAAGIALAVIRFTAQILTQGHEDVVDVLHQLNAVALGEAMEAHPAPAGARTVRITTV